MWRVTLRGIRAHGGRFVLTAVSVMLGVAFLTGTLALRDIMYSTLQGIVTTAYSGDAYAVGPRADGPAPSGPASFGQTGRAPIEDRLTSIIAAVDGVKHASASYTGSGVLIGKDGAPVTIGQAPTIITAVYPFPPGPNLIAGRLPKGTDQILLDQAAAQRANYKVGDTATLLLAGKASQYQVVGISSFGAPMAGATLIFLDADTLRPLFSPAGKVPNIAIELATSSEPKVVLDRIQEAVGPEARIVAGDKLRAEATEHVNEQLGFVSTFLLVFVAIALAIGVFIISNTFQISVRSRAKEFALLRALGASGRQVFWVVSLQAVAVGLLGSALGVALGWGLVLALGVVLSWFGLMISSTMHVSAAVVGTALMVGTLVTWVASLLPARRAGATPPVEVIRQSDGATERPLLVRTLLGLVLAAGGTAAFAAAATGTWFAVSPEATLGAGAAALLVGALAISPWLGRGFFRVVAWPVGAISPVVGRLARGNLLRAPRRTAATAGALMIGMALVSAGGAIAQSTEDSMAEALRQDIAADLVVSALTPAVDPEPAAKVLEQVPGIKRVYADFRAGTIQVMKLDGQAQEARVGSITLEEATTVMPLRLARGQLESLDQGLVLVSAATAQSAGWKLGDSITLTGAAGSYTAKIGAVVESAAYRVDFFVDGSVFRQVAPQRTAASLILATLAPGADAQQVASAREAAQTQLNPFHVYRVYTLAQFQSALAEAVRSVLAVIYGLLALSIVIAVLGIINTLSLSVTERTREIGLLRAVGLSAGGTGFTVVVESLLISLYGTLLGAGIGLGLAAGLRYYLRDQGLSVFSVPWLGLGGMLGVAVVAGLLAAWGPARRAARLPVLESIASE